MNCCRFSGDRPRNGCCGSHQAQAGLSFPRSDENDRPDPDGTGRKRQAGAFLFQSSTVKRIVLIAGTLPIAIFTNGLRVIGTGILAQFWGAEAAQGFFHEFAGLAVFALAMVLLCMLSVGFKMVGK